MRDQKTPIDIIEKLTSVLPRELERFNPLELAQSFKNVVDRDLLTEHLWHNHFQLLFWKKVLWIGLGNLSTIIDYMVKIEYLDEIKWWNTNFLPGIDYYIDSLTSEAEAQRMITSLEALEAKAPEIETASYAKKLKERIVYLKTKHVLLQNAHFYKMVQADLKYFQEKEKNRIANNL